MRERIVFWGERICLKDKCIRRKKRDCIGQSQLEEILGHESDMSADL